MKITFSKEEFLKQLYPLMSTVSTKNTIPAIEGILIETLDDGTVRLTSYDMLKGVRAFITDVEIEEKGSYIINANKLLQILKVLPSESRVTVSVDETYHVEISSERSSFSLFAMKGADFPGLPELSGEKGFAIKGAVLKKIIGQTIHSVAQDDIRPILTGAHFSIKEGKLSVVSCNSHALSICSVNCDIADIGTRFSLNESLNIPGHALLELVRLIGDGEEDVKIYLGFKHAIFHVGGVLFFTRLLDGEYIDYNRFIPREQTIFITLDKKRLQEGLERAMLIAEEKITSGKSYVKLTLDGNSLTITSNSQGGKVSDEMFCVHDGADLEIGFNCRLLLDSVRAADSDVIKITLKAVQSGITIEPAEKKEDSDYFYMVLPVRMNG